MKTTKMLMSFFISIIFSFYSYGQHMSSQNLKKYHESSIQDAKYIFEGQLICWKPYYNKKGKVMTCCIVQITKVYRGAPQLKLGTVKIITRGGHMQGSDIYVTESDGGAYLPQKNGVILGIPTEPWNVVDTMSQTDNMVVLGAIDFIDISEKTAQWSGDKIRITVDSVYSFFKENGLMVQEEQK